MYLSASRFAAMLLMVSVASLDDLEPVSSGSKANQFEEAASEPVDDEIVVIGRKMRLVKLTYHMVGPYVRKCDISVSSGDARIDRIVCAMVKSCVREGHREPLEATACVKGKIEEFGNASSKSREPTDIPSSSNGKSSDQTGKSDDEITVVGTPQPQPGLWRFSAMSTVQGKIMPLKSWDICIRSDAVETAIEQMLGRKVSYDASGVCKLGKLTVSSGSVSGLRQCTSLSGRSRTEISGRYNSVEISLSERTETSGYQRMSDGSRIEALSITTGRHVGVCRN
ncbi:hypothetical protein DMC47_08300 [Nostoc sp. 3335mG]|nr:hypothetical protein DMC47_08300 [Nostoc sp. 3335mG]